MAIAKISHIRLVGLRRDQNKILDSLTAKGLFEVRTTDDLPFGERSGDTRHYRELMLKRSKVSFALDFLKARHAEMDRELKNNKKAVKQGLAEPMSYVLSDEKYSDSRILITRADFSDAAAKEYDLLCACAELEKISFDIVDLKARKSELEAAVKEYSAYINVPVKLSELKIKGDISLAVYQSKNVAPSSDVMDALPCAYEFLQGECVNVVTVCRAKYDAEVDKKLSALGFVRCPFDDDCMPLDKVKALTAELDDIKRHILNLNEKALGYEKHLKDLRILYDVIGLDIERAEAQEKFLKTDSTFVLEGWLPEAVAEPMQKELADKYENVFIQLLAPEEKDAPPTLVVNNKVVKPYEQITDMYSSPRYREIDPNPIMAIFYFLFFGIMIGDAAYGLILAVVGLIVGRSKKFDTGFKRLALLVGMGGISAIIWGVLLGGYFAIDFGDTKVALWFNPLEDPMKMLIVSIVLGCVQITVGYIIKFVALCKDGKPFSAIFDAGSIIILFVALAFLGLSMTMENAPQWMTLTALVLACIGVAIILFTGGRASKNIFGKIIGGFKGLYGLVNLLSDVLSYCRLFGLCLASCAIGLAFNSLGSILFGAPFGIGYVFGVIILIPLHAFNIAIGVLSAYVHDARLQFLEFYGKFYNGGGRLFYPLGEKTKYIRYS